MSAMERKRQWWGRIFALVVMGAALTLVQIVQQAGFTDNVVVKHSNEQEAIMHLLQSNDASVQSLPEEGLRQKSEIKASTQHDKVEKEEEQAKSPLPPAEIRANANVENVYEKNRDYEYALFYNVYIPLEQNNTENALRIVEEQLEQIKKSFAVVSRNTTTTLYFNTIGKGGVLTQEFVQEYYCNEKYSATTESMLGKLRCIHLKHYDEGFEEITLKDLHKWCSQEPDDNHIRHLPSSRIVTYLHNKGSMHHKGGFNDKWRRFMTSAVTSSQCIINTSTTSITTAPGSSSSCQVCGLLWQSIPFFHFPGNFYTAQCDYIQQLHSPADYEKKNALALEALETIVILPRMTLGELSRLSNGTVTNTMGEAGTQQQRFFLTANLDSTRWRRLAQGRFQWEAWLGSHPALTSPCHVAPCNSTTIQHALNSFSQWQSVGDLSPHDDLFELYHVPEAGKFLDIYQRIKGTYRLKSRRLRDIYLLPGLLWKWFFLYNAFPDASPSSPSWVYSYFPEGEDWRRRVQKVLANRTMIGTNNNLSIMQDLFALADREDGIPAVPRRTQNETNNRSDPQR